MPKLIVQHPIHTLDNQLLVPPGTFLTQETLNAVINSQKPCSQQTYPLLSFGLVKADCSNLLRSPPYSAIFSEKEQINDILNILVAVQLAIPVLQTLDYFKQYDFYTYAHVLKVFALSTLLANNLMHDYQEVIRLSATGPTHDIGKICVPLHILKKTTPLTKTERGFIEHHSAAGYVLLNYYYQEIQSLASKVALDHHERRDSSGYPRGVPLQDPVVEIIAVSDIYDALVTPRPYRSTAYDNRAALEEITKMAEQNKIGWDAVRILIAHNRKSKPQYREMKISAEKRSAPPAYNVYGMISEEGKT